MTRVLAAPLLAIGLVAVAGCGAATSDDEAEILAHHAAVIAAHVERDVDAMLADTGADYIVVSRGDISYPSESQRRERFTEYFGMTSFTTYRDLVPPIVRVSADGKMAWLVAQVEVAGVQARDGETRDLYFVSAWIELYEKHDGKWVRTGNVSNFRPPAS